MHWDIVGGSVVLMLAWAAIALMMYEGQRIALKAWAKARAEILAQKLYKRWLRETSFRIHTGVRIIDETKTGGEENDTL